MLAASGQVLIEVGVAPVHQLHHCLSSRFVGKLLDFFEHRNGFVVQVDASVHVKRWLLYLVLHVGLSRRVLRAFSQLGNDGLATAFVLLGEINVHLEISET